MVLGQFAELEPAITSSRTKEALRELRAVGRGLNHAFAGFKFVGDGENRSMVLCRRSVALKRLAYWLQQIKGLSAAATSQRIEELIAKREGRRPLPVGGLDIDCARWYFQMPMKVIESMSQSAKGAVRSLSRNKRMRGVIYRAVGTGNAYHSRVQWPRIRAYTEAKRREARERTSRRDEELHDSGDR
jgi:hypothetical protein